MTFSLIAWELRRQSERLCFSMRVWCVHACVWTKEGELFSSMHACVFMCVLPPYCKCTLERERESCVYNVSEGVKSSWLHEICETQTQCLLSVSSERQILGEWGKTGLPLLFMAINALCIPLSVTGCMFMCSPSIFSHTQWRFTDMFVYFLVILSIGWVCVRVFGRSVQRVHIGYVLLHIWLIVRMNATLQEKDTNWRAASSFYVSLQHWLLSGSPYHLCFSLPPHHLTSHLLYLCGVVIWLRVSLSLFLFLFLLPFIFKLQIIIKEIVHLEMKILSSFKSPSCCYKPVWRVFLLSNMKGDV